MTSKGKKNSNAGKKGKTQDSGKKPEKKILTDTPVVTEVDKDKMAAFFSADEKAAGSGQEQETKAAPAAAPAAPQDPEPPAPEKEKAAANSDNGSFSLVFLFIILGVIGVGWFYYVGSHSPRVEAAGAAPAAPAVEVQAPALAQKIKALEARIAGLQARLAKLEARLHKSVAAAPVTGPVPVKPAPVTKDSSFKKAPVPFWRQEQFRHPAGPGKSLIKPRPVASPTTKPETKPETKPAAKPATPVLKPAAGAGKTAPPAVKDSSFSKAPVPFWRQESFKSPASRAAAVLKRNAARTAAKSKAPDAAGSDGSFSKAPKPFWEK